MAETNNLERSIWLSVAEGALATVMGSLTTGVFLTGFALALGASRLQIGVLAALPTLASFAQLAGAFVIEREGKSKPLCMVASTASRLLWLPVLATPLLASPTTRV